MNKLFAEHVTSTAFFLSISKKQIRYLETLAKFPPPHPAYYTDRPFPDNFIASYGALVRKGLIERVVHEQQNDRGHYELTRAGILVCELLQEAGLMSVTGSIEVAA